MEAEYMGETHAAKEIRLGHFIIDDLGPSFARAGPTPLFADNLAAIKFAEEQSLNDRTKHIDLRHHYLNSLVEAGEITMNYVCTDDNIADILTKPLVAQKFAKFSAFIMGRITVPLRALIRKLTDLNAVRHKNL